MPETGSGYVTDVDYVRSFLPELAPAWLDHVALISSVEPPSRHEGFSWCDLGCGMGGNAILLAATHPQGRFFGIDLMPTHIENARRLAKDGGVGNVQFFNVDFAAAVELQFPKFDYIISHGVYSWVDVRTQRNLRTFIQRHLKPGGRVYLSYNAMPGRAPDIAFQYLLRAFADRFSGTSIERVSRAMSNVRDLRPLKPLGLDRSFAQIDLQNESERYPVPYIAHEFMGDHWKPLFVTEVRKAMAEIGLSPIGSATLIHNYDSFVLRKAAREVLAGITDVDLKELVRDFFLDQRFRRDVFISGGVQRLDEAEQRRRLLDSTYCLLGPATNVTYEVTSEAGQLRFDNAFARKIVAGLATGPRQLKDIVGSRKDTRKWIANALVLCAARMIRPVEGGNAGVQTINAAILRRLGGPEEIRHLVLPCGTAIRPDRAILLALRDGTKWKRDGFQRWRKFLTAYGV